VAELGKAFPGVTVVRADGEHRVERVSGKPSLVVATRGAEPVAEGGYRACLLLDGDAMLQRPSLSALTETLGAWEHAIALLRSDAIAYLTDLTGAVPTAFASGAVDQLIARELHDRSALRLPPTVRLASLEGPQEAVSEIASTLGQRHEGVSVLGSRLVGEGVTRLVMRVPYQAGREVSLTLRAAIVKHATNRRRGTLSMRVAMDDHRALDELAGVAQ
jgi:primosomal protein N' (replication factor Y)